MRRGSNPREYAKTQYYSAGSDRGAMQVAGFRKQDEETSADGKWKMENDE